MLNNQKRLHVFIRVVLAVLAIFFIYCCTTIVAAAPVFAVPAAEGAIEETSEVQVVLIETPVTFDEYDYKIFYDIELSNNYVVELQECINVLDAAMCPNEYTEEAMTAMASEKARLQGVITTVQADIARYTTWEQEYYYAAKTYEFLRQNGYSAEVACGIIGNMMIETSGGTLKLKPTVYSPNKSFYGLCQWSRSRRPKSSDGSDATFEEQLVYLHNDIPKQFKACGRVFNTSHEKFLSIKSPAKAALIFAKVYERCGTGSYNARKRAANVAYEYFTGEAS